MANPRSGPKGGRPRSQIDKEQFEKLCGIQCTLEEIASYFDVDEGTIETWCKRTYRRGFSDIFRLKRGKGRISLRRKQYELALAGDRALLIWLGKQYLGQAEKLEQKLNSSNVIKIDSEDEQA